MSGVPAATSTQTAAGTLVPVILRLILGGVFIYMGVTKAMHPAEFLKLVRQYDVLPQPILLNVVAATVPWFEILCGLLLVLGVAVRGVALVALLMLMAFTAIVLIHARSIQATGGLPFCAIKFDCGCGTGEMFVCRKLGENVLLMGASVGLLFARHSRFCARPDFFH